MKILDCKQIALDETDRLKNLSKWIYKTNQRVPKLAMVMVGNNKDDCSYMNSIMKRFDKIGFEYECFNFGNNEKDNFYDKIHGLNIDDNIDGILVFRPLPISFDEEQLMSFINPVKDVDGISYINMGRLIAGNKYAMVPATVLSIIKIIEYFNIPVEGKRVCVVSRSLNIGKPLIHELLNKNALVEVCHSKIPHQSICTETYNADVIITAIGKPGYFDDLSCLNKYNSRYVIDAGVSFYDGKMYGDWDLNAFKDVNVNITPVPHGVGAVTTTMLASNLLKAYNRRKELENI